MMKKTGQDANQKRECNQFCFYKRLVISPLPIFIYCALEICLNAIWLVYCLICGTSVDIFSIKLFI